MVQEKSGQSDHRLPQADLIERAVLALRWFVLVIAFGLSFFDPATEGILVPALSLVVIVGAYDLLVLLLRQQLRSRRQALGLLALDTVLATAAVYLSGGVHSSFFVLYVFAIVSSAFYLDLIPTILLTLVVSALYAVTCLLNPAGIFSPAAGSLLSIKLTLVLVPGLVSALLVEELRRERFETEREAVLAARLAALNKLFQELSLSLDVDHVLQTIVRASCRMLGADVAAISLLDENRREAYIAAADGLLATHVAEERWPLDEEPFRSIVAGERPYALGEAGELPARIRRIVEREGVKAMIDVPLTLDHVPIGLLSVAQRTPRTFTADERSLLTPLAHEAALAIRNARLYELEKRQVEQLRTLERLRDNFVSYVSHELRTPLTSIKTSVALLEETQSNGFSPVQQDLMQTVTHNVGRLESMVSELIQVTQLEGGRVVLRLQPTDVRTVARRAMRSVQPLFDGKGQALEFHAPEQMDWTLADRHYLENVLVNLLSNAHKYTPQGSTTVIELVDNPERVEFAVSDNGPGIPPSEQASIFDKFYVGAEARNGAGVGLGLYITRMLVELFGGRIWLDSEPPHGSTFRFTLPKKEPADEDLDR